MARHSNKRIAEIIAQSLSPTVDSSTKVHVSSSAMRNDNVDDIILERKNTLATEGFSTYKFCELILKDRNRLSKENALTICDY
jgi:homoaconitase/3-isopropylmalate dehydratase large subunit